MARIPAPGSGAELAAAFDAALAEPRRRSRRDVPRRVAHERRDLRARRAPSCDCCWSGRTRRGASTSPTRCRPATAGSAPASGRSPATGIAPDVVTLGKPMGNGYPVAAVVTRRELADRFAYAGRTFSTFGGNPVAASAALAVLDVLEDERLPERAAEVGERCGPRSQASASRTSSRCAARGLLAGVQLSSGELAARVADELREQGVLVGLTGKHEDVLKIRPPLVFADEHAELLVSALDANPLPSRIVRPWPSSRRDAQLVSRCREGDPAAWNEFVERFSRYVYAICGRGFRLAAARRGRRLPGGLRARVREAVGPAQRRRGAPVARAADTAALHRQAAPARPRHARRRGSGRAGGRRPARESSTTR